MKIAFTSCMDATRVGKQPVWERIGETQPDVLLLLGDQIYMDWGLGGTHWRAMILKDKVPGLQAFAHEMHARYEAQAAIEPFRRLLDDMRKPGRQFLLTWDDHDFAWNNAEGVPVGQSGDTHSTPPEVKAISLALFRQFEKFLRAPTQSYPALSAAAAGPVEHWVAGPKGIEMSATLSDARGMRVPIEMLDTRWYRTPRQYGARSILGAQYPAIRAAVQKSEGLLILAAGSPMQHSYLAAEQDWVGKPADPEDRYVEYEQLLADARRPVLYLSGDIHRVCWSGRINSHATPHSQVVQVLASPAAIARFGPKKFTPGFGIVVIEGEPAAQGRIDLTLHQLDEAGGQAPVYLKKSATFSQAAWQQEHMEGEAGATQPFLEGEITDREKMAVLVALDRRKGIKLGEELTAALDATAAIDDCYKEAAPESGFQEPMWAAVETRGKVETLVLRPAGDLSVPLARENLTRAVIEQAFEQALRTQGRPRRASVVFYIHGAGKSPTSAIDQGYALRGLYNCEPVVYCWPAGWSEGGVARYFDAFNARRLGPQVLPGLRQAIEAFAEIANDPRFSTLAKVLVARSAGAAVLKEILLGGDSNGRLAGIDRIVLSAPGIEAGDFNRKTGNAFAKPDIGQVAVTVNANDAVLGFSRWLTKVGPALGAAIAPADERHEHVTYLDFTRSDGVGRLHDYLLLDLGPAQQQANFALLTQKRGDFDTGAVARQGEPNVFDVQ